MNRHEIKSLIPHREPMLLVDEITMDDSGAAHGIYEVRGDEFFLQGHFPGNPVVPGVILLEIMAQTCALLVGDKLKGKTPYYTGVDKVRFKQKVRPGDKVEVRAVISRSKDVFYFTRCEVLANGKPCASGELSFAIMDTP